MSEVGGGGTPSEVSGVSVVAVERTAGALLRQAREQQGMDLAAFAAQLKVPVRKLEALEADRFDELPGATFVRALALTACRGLKLDPAEVLGKLPQAVSSTLDNVTGGLNQAYQDPSDGRHLSGALAQHRGVLLIMATLLVGAALLWLAPADWLSRPSQNGVGASVPAASGLALVDVAASHVAAATSGVAGLSVASAVPGASVASAGLNAGAAGAVGLVTPLVAGPAASSSSPAASVPGGRASAAIAGRVSPLAIRVREASWVEVADAGSGQILLGRLLAANEAVNLDAPGPVRLKVGNAAVTQVSWRGQAVDLAAVTKDNVARVELK